jgi:hypothetical protein
VQAQKQFVYARNISFAEQTYNNFPPLSWLNNVAEGFNDSEKQKQKEDSLASGGGGLSGTSACDPFRGFGTACESETASVVA